MTAPLSAIAAATPFVPALNAGCSNQPTGPFQITVAACLIFSAYSASVFGPKSAGTVLREILLPFEDLGMVGAGTTQRRRAGGTDSTSFNEAGLPGIGLGQDPIQYNSHTWHTNLDTYERIVEDDVKQAAIVVAGAVYHLAMRDELLPRLTKEDMPRPPARPN